jgi:hypothetical protein
LKDLKLVSFLIFLIFSRAQAQTVPTHLLNPIGPAQARMVLDQVREPDLLNLLMLFVGCCHPSRVVGTPSHLKAHQWLDNYLGTLKGDNLTYYAQEFDLDIAFALNHFESQSAEILKHLPNSESKNRQDILSLTQSRSAYLNDLKKRNVKGKNFFFEIQGSTHPQDILLLVTHFDSITINKENWTLDLESQNLAADANGSGVASLLMLSQILTQLNLPRTVRFLFLDAQSLGSLGARAYLKDQLEELRPQNIRHLQVMAIGQTPPRQANIRLQKDGSFQEEDHAFAQEFLTRAQRLSPGINFELSTNPAPQGDHNVFGKRVCLVCY